MNANSRCLIGLIVVALAGCQSATVKQPAASNDLVPLSEQSLGDTAMIQGKVVAPAPVALESVSPNARLKQSRQSDIRLRTIDRFSAIEGAAEQFAPRKLAAKEMAVHAIDVGQGDAFLLEFACGAAMIDTGLQPTNARRDRLVNYVEWFFNERRPDLNKKLDLLVISHSHADHADGVPYLFGNGSSLQLTVENTLDNGYDVMAGTDDQEFMRTHAQHYQPILVEQIPWLDGATSPIIDPIGDCGDGIDPILRVLWGGWSDVPEAFENPNHHSVVMRVDYGEASFLFTGDLQTNQDSIEGGGLNLMLDDYEEDMSVFDVDALKVSHHGAENGTVPRLLEATKPCLAFMGVGPHDEGGRGSAKGHGHPRADSITLLNGAVSGVRDRRDVWTFDGGHGEPRRKQINKAIFGTAWDGHYVIYANSAGKFKVQTEQGEAVSVSCSS